jgi:hypothetical protein
MQMPEGLQNDPYAAVFASTLEPKVVGPLGAQERENVVGMLQRLSQETDQLEKMNQLHGSFREQVGEVKALQEKVNSVTATSDGGK